MVPLPERGLKVGEAARPKDNTSKLPELISVVDAKSLYDHLHSETAGTSNDRRTAIEVQITRSPMQAQDASVRWVDHSLMHADAMTKQRKKIRCCKF